MTKKPIALFAAAFALAGVATYASTADAWWERIPGASCAISVSENEFGINGPYTGGSLALSVWSTDLNASVHAFCPFTNSETHIDGQANNVTVDVRSIEAADANTIGAAACTYSGWTISCGAYSWNTPIPISGGTTGLRVTDLSAWHRDYGGGYADVEIIEHPSASSGSHIDGGTPPNTATMIAGVFVSQ